MDRGEVSAADALSRGEAEPRAATPFRVFRPPVPSALVDGQRRRVGYLRLSVTDRCNFRCRYCMPEEGVAFVDRKELLRFEEIEVLVRAFVSLGISRVRLTGGEPTLRRGLVDLVARLARIPGVEDLSMTTNGWCLDRMAAPLAEAGLRRVNISIDSLRPDRFRRITRTGELDRVLAGLEAAREAGLRPLKLNAVVVRGFNDDELPELVRFAAERDAVLRLIEYMPIGADGFWSDATFLPTAAMIERLEADFRVEAPLGYGPEAGVPGEGPAVYRDLTPRGAGPDARPTRVGFISALSHTFCSTCNRVRMTATGTLQECLAFDGRLSLRDELRAGADESALARLIEGALWGKRPGHGFEAAGGGERVARTMSVTGG